MVLGHYRKPSKSYLCEPNSSSLLDLKQKVKIPKMINNNLLNLKRNDIITEPTKKCDIEFTNPIKFD